MSRGEFDLLVIGGGSFGACAAWDAALKGLRVALIEKGDFMCGSSAPAEDGTWRNPLSTAWGRDTTPRILS